MNTNNTEFRPKLPTIWRPSGCDDIVWFRPEELSRARSAFESAHVLDAENDARKAASVSA